jgi:hypothetical protein
VKSAQSFVSDGPEGVGCQSHRELPGSSIWWVSWLRPRASTGSRWLPAKALKLPVKASRLLLEARRLLTKASQLRPEARWLLAEARWLLPDAHWLLAEAAGLLPEAGWRQEQFWFPDPKTGLKIVENIFAFFRFWDF